jgi:hypothetical protein
MTIGERTNYLANGLAAHLGKKAIVYVSLVAALGFLITWRLAQTRPFWFDELFTLRIACAETVGEMWSILSSGKEPHPPLSYLAVRATTALFGQTEWAARLPAMVGFWILCLCLYGFAAQRVSAPFAWLAFLLPIAADAFRFAVEARAYGQVMGLCGLSLISWQGACQRSTHRLGWLIGLAVSLAAAISSHFYAVTMVGPLLLGELVRTIERRRIDVPIWLALGAGLIPLALFFPTIQRAQTVLQHGFFSKAGLADIPPFYVSLVGMGTLAFIGMVMIVAFLPRFEEQTDGCSDPRSNPRIPWHELAAASGFLLLPPIAIGLVRLGIGVFGARYLIFTIAGLSLLVAFTASRLVNGSALAGLALVSVLVLVCGGRVYLLNRDFRGERDWVQFAVASLKERQARTDLPFVFSNPISYLQMTQYAPPDVRKRMTYLVDPEKSMQYLGYNTCDKAMSVLKEWVAPETDDYDSFRSSHSRFIMLGNEFWLPSALLDDKATLRMMKNREFLVELPTK